MWVGITQYIEGLHRTKCRGRLNLSAWLQSCDTIFSYPQPSWFSGLQTQAGLSSISSMTLRLLNSITGFPESPACRRSFMGFLSLYNCVSQFLIIYLSICLPAYLPPSLLPSYWFCFCGEQMRWVQLLPCSLRRKCLLWTISRAPIVGTWLRTWPRYNHANEFNALVKIVAASSKKLVSLNDLVEYNCPSTLVHLC